MTIIYVSEKEVDNEVWLYCSYEGFPYNENGCSRLEAERRLRIAICKNNPHLKKNDLEFEYKS